MSRVYINPLKGKKYKAELSIGSGKERKRKTHTFNDKETAKKWIHQMEIAIDQGTNFEKANWKFIEYYKYWIDLYKKPLVSANTLDTYYVSLKHYLEHMIDVKMEDLTRGHIQSFLNELGLSHETARKDLTHIRSCLRDAVSDGVIPRSPADGHLQIVSDPKRTKSDDKKFMSIADYKMIRDFLLNYHYYLTDVDRLALLVISQTGLRVGECLALKYDDIDFLHNTIRVDESCDSVHMILKEPKTQHAKRTIPVPEKVMNILKKWMRYQRTALLRYGIINERKFLLWGRDNRLPKAQNINASYHQIQVKLGMTPKFSTHTLRHTLASLMIADRDISLSYISRYLGHASTAITQKYYIGLLPEQVEVEASKVLKVIEG